MSALCEIYWYPLYAYLRRSGKQANEAEDLLQGFLVRFLEGDRFGTADPEKGRLRSYLIASLKNYEATERSRAKAVKRGGREAQVSIDFVRGETTYGQQLTDLETPERLFERRWAALILGRALDKTRAAYEAAGNLERFEHLKALLDKNPDVSSRKIAASLGLTEDAVRQAARRLRRSFIRHLRAGVSETLIQPSEIDDEIRYLRNALR